MQQAQQQITQLQNQLNAAPAATGGGRFLSPAPGLDTHFGRTRVDDAIYNSTAYAGVPAGTPPQRANAAPTSWRERLFGSTATTPSMAPAAPTGSGFLGQAAASAAGIAGGMLLFNGLNHMLGSQTHAAANNAASSLGAEHNAATASNNGGLDQLAQEAGRDHVGQSPSSQPDDSGADDSFGSNFSDGGDVFDDDWA